jgi:hypothetical protein
MSSHLYAQMRSEGEVGESNDQETLTEGRDDVTRVHGVFVLDKAKPVHELDFCDFASAMSGEVALNICLGS